MNSQDFTKNPKTGQECTRKSKVTEKEGIVMKYEISFNKHNYSQKS